jgi:predicted protein tyrosine phosphatase
MPPVEAPLARQRILFICTANLDRSRTAEDLYGRDPRYDVRSAGTASFATQTLSRELLQWADRVFVMNERHDQHRTQLRMRFPDVKTTIVDLNVEDRWRRGDPQLVQLLLRRLSPHLGEPQD